MDVSRKGAPTPVTTPEAVLAAVEDAVIGRRGTYGDPADFFVRVAKRWSLTLGVTVQPWQVPLLMDDFKTERVIGNPGHVDSWVDGAGYKICGPSVVARLTGADLKGGGHGDD